jgi:hypothetical protein
VSAVNAGTYTIIPMAGTLSAANYDFPPANFVSGMLTINPTQLTATPMDFAATAGAPFTKMVATFTNADPIGRPDSYTATIDWGDQSSSPGLITDNGDSTYSVSGSHTYADPVNKTVQISIQHKLGNTTTATTTANATVTSLGKDIMTGQSASISFWQGPNGQSLILSFNGSSTSTALATWLATTFPNLYGATTGDHNLTGKTNADVVALFLNLAGLPDPKVDAEVLATALNVYATTKSLGGTAGQAYMFVVDDMGLGARSYNVGPNGKAFGVDDNKTLNVYQLLLAANNQAVNGVLYGGNTDLLQMAFNVFDGINTAGGIF